MVDLRFLGIGSAFNTALGNNSAFFIRDRELIIIDCGGSVFGRLKELNVFEKTDNIYVVVTHMHPDHVGSLGDLIFYSHYILKKRIKVLFPESAALKTYLSLVGVKEDMYTLLGNSDFKSSTMTFAGISADYIRITHSDTLPAYGYIFNVDEYCFYYSGDSNNISDEIIKDLKDGKIQSIYQDTCGLDYEGNGHLSFKKLCGLISQQYRNKVYCMHLDEHITKQQIEENGFNAVNITQQHVF